EHSPWVAEGAWDAGLNPDSAGELHARMCAVLQSATREQRLGVLNAHPDLAGRLALAGGLTADSTAEQASAGLDKCSPAEFERLQALNDAYKAKFGFPFIMAVKGRTRAEIIQAFEERVNNDTETEFATALRQVERIALLRLDDMLS
ncbi:MAG: 2-oxo-4-hydroxy-4-carboxy-5-ureidoimidazoline decarboxylase, partial [Alphaproteobacteria bacterium]|nr:2-oxo-4-hydroxy-4-carboxy-5-ureidoimidazoline decarboxylase [Alphaproteobacteria bacterium]